MWATKLIQQFFSLELSVSTELFRYTRNSSNEAFYKSTEQQIMSWTSFSQSIFHSSSPKNIYCQTVRYHAKNAYKKGEIMFRDQKKNVIFGVEMKMTNMTFCMQLYAIQRLFM